VKVRILENRGGLLNMQTFPSVGEVVELDDALAFLFVSERIAEPVAQMAAETRETAAEAAPEKRGPGRPRKTP
jgi:hypothetical protein